MYVRVRGGIQLVNDKRIELTSLQLVMHEEKLQDSKQRRNLLHIFATVGWVDVFTRQIYRDIFLDSIRYCQKEKGLEVFSWCIMSNHVHMIIRSNVADLSGTIRDLKKYTSKKCIEIIHNENESRRDRTGVPVDVIGFQISRSEQ